MAAEAARVFSIKRRRNVYFFTCIFLRTFLLTQIITYEIIQNNYSPQGSVIIVNKNLDFVSVFIHR